MAPLAGPICEVLTIAKRDLKAGKRLDGVGGFCSYGLIDNRAAARAVDALPIGLSEGCVLRRDLAKDAVVSFDDVESPSGRLAEKLWREQNQRWSFETAPSRTQVAPSAARVGAKRHATLPHLNATRSRTENGARLMANGRAPGPSIAPSKTTPIS